MNKYNRWKKNAAALYDTLTDEQQAAVNDRMDVQIQSAVDSQAQVMRRIDDDLNLLVRAGLDFDRLCLGPRVGFGYDLFLDLDGAEPVLLRSYTVTYTMNGEELKL